MDKPTFILAEKGSKTEAAVTSSEKGKNVIAICFCNAKGNFLPASVY